MKRKLLPVLTAMFVIVAMLVSCEGDDPREEQKEPSVTFPNETGIYRTKIGHAVTIQPTVSDAIDPYYVWKLNGKVVGREASYEFLSEFPGEYYLTFGVAAANGTIEKEARVDVMELTPPVVVLPAEEGIIKAVIGRELDIEPQVTPGEGATYRWLLNRQEVSTQPAYRFMKEELGDYDLTLFVTNEDGEGRADAVIRVGEVPELTFFFENETITVPLGRKAVLAPYISYGTESTIYKWEVDGAQQSGQTGTMFGFTPSAEGSYKVSVTGTSAENSASATVTVQCTPSEGTYLRVPGASSSPYSTSVFDFLPAPGQFVNKGYNPANQQEANEYARQTLSSGNSYLSLGGFGGYVVVGFDHSISNTSSNSGYDLAIKGNAFKGSSEPGIVWVMQDENGNGLPDDTWYELRGSETGKKETMQQYAVTYFKPAGSRQNVRWTDNLGNTGTVDVNGFHSQDSYYPCWITASSYTLRGTCLGGRNNFDPSTGFWANNEYDWGYADNCGEDYVNNETLLNLDNAVYPDGTPVKLNYIDFVKVQVGVNGKSGALGEISTEVLRFRDMNIAQ